MLEAGIYIPEQDASWERPGEVTEVARVCHAKLCFCEEVVAMVMSMGFTKDQTEAGLRNTDNNVERAIEWIFSHPDGEEPETASSGGETPAQSAFTDVKDGEARYKKKILRKLGKCIRKVQTH